MSNLAPLLFLIPRTENDLRRQIKVLQGRERQIRRRAPKKLIFLNADDATLRSVQD